MQKTKPLTLSFFVPKKVILLQLMHFFVCHMINIVLMNNQKFQIAQVSFDQ